MKLPKEYDLYGHNKYLDSLAALTDNLRWGADRSVSVKDVCTSNLRRLEKANNIITHLELALDEVLKLESKRDEQK